MPGPDYIRSTEHGKGRVADPPVPDVGGSSMVGATLAFQDRSPVRFLGFLVCCFAVRALIRLELHASINIHLGNQGKGKRCKRAGQPSWPHKRNRTLCRPRHDPGKDSLYLQRRSISATPAPLATAIAIHPWASEVDCPDIRMARLEFQ